MFVPFTNYHDTAQGVWPILAEKFIDYCFKLHSLNWYLVTE